MKNNRRWLPLAIIFGTLSFVVRAQSEPNDLEQNRRQLEQWQADPEHYARLRRDLRDFLASPAERQEQLRRLDHDLHEETSASSAHLHRVLDRYADWLQRLPEADREQVEGAPNTVERLRRIRALRESEWVNRLPQATRAELRKLPPEQQPARIAELRHEERDRHAEWHSAMRRWDDLVRSRTEAASLEQLKPAIQAFAVDSLMPMLSPGERARLRQTEGRWPQFAHVLVELADKHPIHLPGPTVGPKRFEELPIEVQKQLPQIKRHAPRIAALIPAQEGKWPEYAQAVTQAAQRAGVQLTKQLGPSRLSEFSPNLRSFCQHKLFPVLTEEERSRRDKAEGHWPAYPQAIAALARKHGLQVPGMGLPGPPALWERLRKESSATTDAQQH